MSKLPARNSVTGFLWRLDAIVSTAVFETWDWIKRASSAYSAFVYRFRLGTDRVDMRLGSWPDKSLADLRALRDQARALVKQGTDPLTIMVESPSGETKKKRSWLELPLQSSWKLGSAVTYPLQEAVLIADHASTEPPAYRSLVNGSGVKPALR